jgi:hypothetical protein
MVFINPIMTTHVNRTVDQPLMNSMVTPKRVALKYHDFKKDVDLDVHVRVFNSVVKTNAKTFEEYIINAFKYTLRDTILN